MGRWRPPSPRSSPYITPGGYQTLQQELSDLWVHRKEVTLALAAAAAEGDRSENAEYIYRKKELREIDRRIRYLQKRIPDLNVVNEVGDQNRIFFSASVTVEDDEGEEMTYRIVGADETDPHSGDISIDSPMARALLGKRVDDEIEVKTAAGVKNYAITRINY